MGEGESKSEKFKRLAAKRVTNAIKKIEMIGNLSSPSYEYTEEEVGKILSALQETLDNVKKKFSAKAPETKKFQF